MGAYGGPKIASKLDLVLALDLASDRVTDAVSSIVGPVSKYNVSLNNSVSFTNTSTNRRRRALQLDGSDDFISFPEVILSPPWSTVAVFKITQSTSSTAFRSTIFGNTSTSRSGFNVVYNDISGSTARIRLLTRVRTSAGTWTWTNAYIGPNGSSYVSFASQDAYWVNNIIHLTTTVSASNTYKFYINGELKNTTARSSDLSQGFRCNKIGAYSTTSLPFKGNIYRTFVYDTELTQNQITQNFNSIKRRFDL